MSSADVSAAREHVLRAAIRILGSEHSEPHTWSCAESEYADELLALAARDLAEATEALPEDKRPVGWNREGK